MVLTQACDLAQVKTTRVVVAPIHEGTQLVAKNILKAGTIRDQVRRGQVFGWYFLPAAPAPINLAESIVWRVGLRQATWASYLATLI